MLTFEQQKKLLTIKEDGVYRDSDKYKRIHNENLYLVFWHYMKWKDKINSIFKVRSFFLDYNIYRDNRVKKYENGDGRKKYILSHGELNAATRYGYDQGFLGVYGRNNQSIKWFFTEEAKI